MPQQSKQTLQPAEETCQQPLASRLLNFAYFYTCVKFFCCRMLLSNMESKSLLKKVDTSLNECLGLVIGCIKSTPTELLLILSGTEPMNIRRNKNILGLRIRAMENTHIFHQAAISRLTNGSINSSKIPLSSWMHHLSYDIDNISPDNWAQHAWTVQWESSNYQLKNFIAYPSSKPPSHDLKRSQWTLPNCLWSGHGRYASVMHRMGLHENVNCKCGAIQTPQDITNCRMMIRIRGDLRTIFLKLLWGRGWEVQNVFPKNVNQSKKI